MPKRSGGGPRSTRPLAPKPKPVVPQYTSEAGLTGSTQQQKAGNNKVQKQVAATSAGGTASAIINSKRAAVQKAGTGGITKRKEVSVQADSKRLAAAVKTGASKTSSQKANADRFGFKAPAPTGNRQRRKFGGVSGGGGGGGTTGGGGGGGIRPGGGGGKTTGGLPGSFKDKDIVGSQNTITEFDGSEFSGGGFDSVGGEGGGGSGSALAGRESVGLANVKQGQSLEDVVYGVQKRGKKVSRARGE